MTYVGVGRRFVAIFVDSIVLLILSGPFAEIRHGDGYLQVDWQGRRMFWPSLIVILYFVLLEGIAGATIGKFLTGIRVVNQTGRSSRGPPDHGTSPGSSTLPVRGAVPRRGDSCGPAHPAATGDHGHGRSRGIVACVRAGARGPPPTVDGSVPTC
jgi:hypothetical protein